MTASTASSRTWRGSLRSEIIARISAARDEGDLKENGGYHAAKDEQGRIEGRICQLEDQLRHATTEKAAADGVVSPGKVVTYRYAGDDETEQFLLGARDIDEDESPVEVFSPQSPLGHDLPRRRRGRSHRLRRPQRQEAEDRDRRRRPVRGLSPGPGRSVLDAVAALPQPGEQPLGVVAPARSSWTSTSTSPTCSVDDVRSCTTSSTLAR